MLTSRTGNVILDKLCWSRYAAILTPKQECVHAILADEIGTGRLLLG